MSVKALAVSCIGAAAALHPEAFFNSLYLEPLDGVPAAGRAKEKDPANAKMNNLTKVVKFFVSSLHTELFCTDFW